MLHHLSAHVWSRPLDANPFSIVWLIRSGDVQSFWLSTILPCLLSSSGQAHGLCGSIAPPLPGHACPKSVVCFSAATTALSNIGSHPTPYGCSPPARGPTPSSARGTRCCHLSPWLVGGLGNWGQSLHAQIWAGWILPISLCKGQAVGGSRSSDFLSSWWQVAGTAGGSLQVAASRNLEQLTSFANNFYKSTELPSIGIWVF